MQEVQQAVGLTVLRTVFGNSRQDALRVTAKHSELDQIGRVEQHVGSHLERIYPFDFGTAHIRPVGYCLPRCEGTLVEIPHDASQKAVVTGRYAVVVVKGDAHNGVYENPEFAGVRNLVKQPRIQGMDSFDEQDGAFFQTETLALQFPQAGHEIVLRHFHFLPGDEPEDIRLEIFVINSLEIVKVEGAVRQTRSVETVHEIVISGEGDWMKSASHQLDAESAAEGALAAACGTRYQHNSH